MSIFAPRDSWFSIKPKNEEMIKQLNELQTGALFRLRYNGAIWRKGDVGPLTKNIKMYVCYSTSGSEIKRHWIETKQVIPE
jgi:hypothetical protein